MARPKGIPSNRKGKKLEEIYGKEKSNLWKENLSKSHKGKLLGNLNPSKRPEVREKIKQNHWLKGKENPIMKGNKYRLGKTPWNKGLTKETDERIKIISISRLGNKNPAWKGGITPINKLLRMGSQFRIWRELIFLRDNFTCQNPNCEFCNNKIGGILNAHHIKSMSLYPKLAFDISNGITYCQEFHIKSKLHIKIPKCH